MYAVELAKALKERNNIDKIGITVGTVRSVNPLRISILGGAVLLQADQLIICKNATEYTVEVTTSEGIGTAIHEGLKVGDRAALIASEDNQRFIVLDKVVS